MCQEFQMDFQEEDLVDTEDEGDGHSSDDNIGDDVGEQDRQAERQRSHLATCSQYFS